MVDDRMLVEAVARLASLATADFDADEMLRQLCRVASQVVPVDGVGVMGVPDDQGHRPRARFVDAVGPVNAAEELQESLQEGPCRDAIDSGEIVVIDDLAGMQRVWSGFAPAAVRQALGAVIAIPLRSRGRVWGTLDLYRHEHGPWTVDEIRAGRMLADVAVSYLVMAFDRDQARSDRLEVEHRSLHDPLTGLPNRRLLFDRIEHALAAARRTGGPIAVAFIDVDRFKIINDTYGHATGDGVLSETAHRLAATVRACDTLARIAGDEFVLLIEQLPRNPEEARPIVDAIAKRLHAALDPPLTGLSATPVTISAGITITPAAGGTSADDLLHVADAAMYEAKARGGSTTVIHDTIDRATTPSPPLDGPDG
ncbi:diguanylate cyclase [Cellulomonas sp. 179-A 4D5 NHS]|uniref:diguanylate cyclase domain-containing protein n=1 Tax=Cellulomonas sp. 179-A 4D5 NHS TaxID=3142378 RepID=UPI0039A21E8F